MKWSEMEGISPEILEIYHDDVLPHQFPDGCEECQWYSVHDEEHPYGSSTATESLSECNIPSILIDECPLVVSTLEAQKEERREQYRVLFCEAQDAAFQ